MNDTQINELGVMVQYRGPLAHHTLLHLWGRLKNAEYEQQPTTREDLMERIRKPYAVIPRNILLFTLRHFSRIDFCIEANG